MFELFRRLLIGLRAPLLCCCPGEPPIQTTCCPAPIPATLTATISGASCAAMNGAWTINYDSGSNEWIGTRIVNGESVKCTFACQGLAWAIFFDHVETAFTIANATGTATSCDPFLWEASPLFATYDAPLDMSCGSAGDTFDVTVSE